MKKFRVHYYDTTCDSFCSTIVYADTEAEAREKANKDNILDVVNLEWYEAMKRTTEQQRFKDFITDNLHFMQWSEKKDKSDTIISKQFKRNGNEYILIARFDKDGGYCYGYLVNAMGQAYVNGKGFDFDFFLSLVKDELNAREVV